MFTHIPTYDYNRTLSLQSARFKGEDVFALQVALDECSFECGSPDGVYGPVTDKAVHDAQGALRLVVDGKVGSKTMRALAMRIAAGISVLTKVPIEAFEGQIEWEAAGFRLGAYSPPRANGSYDAGITQRNTELTPPKEGFDPALSIRALGERIHEHWVKFDGVKPARRRMELAQGSWNAPAFACYIAKQEGATKVLAKETRRPSSESRNAFENYMSHVSRYLKL